jgi:hypothetical protein
MCNIKCKLKTGTASHETAVCAELGFDSHKGISVHFTGALRPQRTVQGLFANFNSQEGHRISTDSTRPRALRVYKYTEKLKERFIDSLLF